MAAEVVGLPPVGVSVQTTAHGAVPVSVTVRTAELPPQTVTGEACPFTVMLVIAGGVTVWIAMLFEAVLVAFAQCESVTDVIV